MTGATRLAEGLFWHYRLQEFDFGTRFLDVGVQGLAAYPNLHALLSFASANNLVGAA